jgi:CMP-N-acetylneuraminic acid synthetase
VIKTSLVGIVHSRGRSKAVSKKNIRELDRFHVIDYSLV